MDKKGKEGGGNLFYLFGKWRDGKAQKEKEKRREDLQSITSREEKRRDLGLVYSTTPEEKKKEVIMFIYSSLLYSGGGEGEEVDP